MTIDQFAAALIQTVKPMLPSHLQNAELTVRQSKEPGHTDMTGICIAPKGSNVAPCYYIDQQYAYFCEGMPITDIASDLVDSIIAHQTLEKEIDDSQIEDFEYAKHNIIACLIDGRKGRNDEFLQNRPCMPFGQSEIKIIFGLQLSLPSAPGQLVMPITNEIMDYWHTSPVQLQQYAVANGPKLRPAVLKPLTEHPAICATPGAAVLTNCNCSQGAAVLLYEDTIRELSEKFPHGYYLLPTSIHEWIVLDKRHFDSPGYLQEILRHQNKQLNATMNVLADDVFEIQNGLLVSAIKAYPRKI